MRWLVLTGKIVGGAILLMGLGIVATIRFVDPVGDHQKRAAMTQTEQL